MFICCLCFFSFLYLAVTISLSVYLGVSVISQSPQNVQALIGLFVLVATCFLLSASPSRVIGLENLSFSLVWLDLTVTSIYKKNVQECVRPRVQWLDVVEADLQQLRVLAWRRKVQDTSEWKDMAEQARGPLHGRSCH